MWTVLPVVAFCVLLNVVDCTSSYEDARAGYMFVFHDNQDLVVALNGDNCYFVAISDLKSHSLYHLSLERTEDEILKVVNGTTPARITDATATLAYSQFHDEIASILCQGKKLHLVTFVDINAGGGGATSAPCVDSLRSGSSILSCGQIPHVCSSAQTAQLCRKHCGLCGSGSGAHAVVTSAPVNIQSTATTGAPQNPVVSTGGNATAAPCVDLLSKSSVLACAAIPNACLSPTMAQLCQKYCGLCVTSAPVNVTQSTTATTGAGCLYKGKIHQMGEQWQENCEYDCVCRDGTTGEYACTALCITWNLPSTCHLEGPPPGMCCKVPWCPAGYTISYPAGFVPK